MVCILRLPWPSGHTDRELVISIVATVGLYKSRLEEKFVVVGIERAPVNSAILECLQSRTFHGALQNQNWPVPGRRHRSLKKVFPAVYGRDAKLGPGLPASRESSSQQIQK